jgi:frataxin-like iron-binding protein CyaY
MQTGTMGITLKINHRRKNLIFRISVEKDDIFIAFPINGKKYLSERIFLTKVNNHWVSDYSNEALVKKLTSAIDAHVQLNSLPNQQNKN